MASYFSLSRNSVRYLWNTIELFKPIKIQKALRHSCFVPMCPRSYSFEDLERIKYNFSVANEDILGKMNVAEFNQFIAMTTGRQLTSQDLEQLFKEMDADRDNYLTFSDIMDHLNKARYDQTMKSLLDVFCKYDKDNDKKLEFHEFKEALFHLGFFQAGKKEVQRFFCARDEKGDGKIDFEQFAAIVKEDMPGLFAELRPRPPPQEETGPRISCKPTCRVMHRMFCVKGLTKEFPKGSKKI